MEKWAGELINMFLIRCAEYPKCYVIFSKHSTGATTKNCDFLENDCSSMQRIEKDREYYSLEENVEY